MAATRDATSRSTTWHVYVHKLRAWVPTEETSGLSPEEQRPTRPHLILVVDTGDGAFLSHEHEENERGNVFVHEPSFEEVVDFIERVRKRPRVLNSSKKDEKEDGSRAKCPERVAFACTKTARHLTDAREAWATYEGCKYVGGCRPLLAERMPEVKEVTFAPVPAELVERVVREQIEPTMQPETQAWGTQHLPGLMSSVDGFTSAFGRSLFSSAEAFAACEPWTKLTRRRPVRVSYRLALRDDVTMKLTAFVGYDGSLDEENFGFTVHKTLTEAQAAFEVDQGNEDVEASVEGQTCMFASAPETPFEDIDACEAHEWPLVRREGEIGDVLWPLFFKISLDDETGDNLEISRPAIVELQCFELAMRAVAESIASGKIANISDDDDEVRAHKGPWTVKASTFAAKGVEETIEVELELPKLAPMKPVEYL